MIIKTKEQLKPEGHIKCTLRNAETGKIEGIYEYDNLIVTAWKSATAQRYAQEANDCDITYGAVGTNNTTPASSDTTLGTENDRNAVTVSAAANVVTATTFFGASEANAALKEFGLFGEAATGSADTGTMVNHVLISITKASSQTLTIEATLTVS